MQYPHLLTNLHFLTYLHPFCFTLFRSPAPPTSPPLPGTTTLPPHTTTSPSPGTSTGTVVSHLSFLVAVLSSSPLAGHSCLSTGMPWMYLSPAGHGEKVVPPSPTTSAFLSAPCSAPPTDCNFACTFDKDFCVWVQEDYSSIDWIRNKGPTPTPNTGPSSDHTTGGKNSSQDTGRGVSPQRWQQISKSERR